MLDKIFDINKFNIFSDEENYYFFRALNMADNTDIENGITLDSNGKIKKICTNRERYDGVAKYSENDALSLEQITDHIKMHQLKETNCISLTSNANTALTYGRGYYKDKYVMVKVPKKELGKSVFEAGLYMLEQINNILNSYIAQDDILKEYFRKIDNCANNDELEEFKKDLIKNNIIKIETEADEINNSGLFEQGYSYNITSSQNYIALNEEQNFEKDKTVLKIDLLNRQILPKISNRLLIQTIGNAFSSLELIHYGEIIKDEIIELPRDITDIFGLLQQMPSDLEYIDEIKRILISKVNKTKFTGSFTYKDFNIEDSSLSVENLYKITGGKVSYGDAVDLYKKAFYLSKSKLRTKRSVQVLNRLLDNNPKYYNTLKYILKKGYGIEPEITTRISKNLVSVSESVSLDINNNKSELVDYINSLNEKYLTYILDSPNNAFEILLPRFLESKDIVERKEWIADAMIDMLDLSRFNIKFNLREAQREAIKTALIENNVEEVYFNLKRQNIKEKDIANVLFTNIIKNKNTIDLNDTFSLEELEYFIGYNRVKGTGLTLRKYQNPIVQNINKNFESKNFTSVILPTGAGKSYIALAEMYQFEKTLNELNKDNHAKILYLAPNDEILNQLKDIIRETYKPELHLTDKDIDQDIKRVFPNLTLSTYQNLKDRTDSDNNIKEIFETKYDFIIFDELHRTGAREWKNHIDELIDNQDSNVKVLGITATPERDVDSRDMTEYWSRKFRYTDNEILEQKHLSYNMDIIEAIKRGIVACPKVVNCIYNLENDMEDLKFSIEEIKDEKLRDEKLLKYEKIRRVVDSAVGIEQVLNENIKKDGKYIVFLPITRKCEDEDGNTIYVDTDGNEVKQSLAHQIINDYQILFHQYLFSDKYLNHNPDVKRIYNKIVLNISLTEDEINYLNHEKNNIMLLSKFEMMYKQNELISQNDLIANEIMNFMNWEKISKKELALGLKDKMKDEIEDYSMLGSYGAKANKKILDKFNKSTTGKTKLMFVMNKLNEGVHVKDISGIVWMRPMDQNSRILFLQQLGRCIKSLDEKQEIDENDIPMVIDLVNNSLKVKLDKNHSLEQDDLENILMVKDWIHSKNRMPSGKSSDKDEIFIAKTIIELQDRYTKYLQNQSLLKEDMKYEKRIIKIGCDIDIWDLRIEFNKTIKEINEKDKTDDVIGLLGLKSITRDFVELKEEIRNQTNNFDKIADFIEKLNNGYKPKSNDPDNTFSNGEPINQFWPHNKDKIISELMNNPKYEVGYETAKEVISSLSFDKIADFIEKLNSGYKPKNNDPDNTFSNGEPINYFWSTNKDKIIRELMNNPKYEVGYEIAKEVISSLSFDKIADFIEKLNNGYKPKSNDPDSTFSNGEPINYFWSTNKDKIIKELMNNPKYEVGYETAKEVISSLSFDKIADFIEKLNSGYRPKSNDQDNTFSNGEPINYFWPHHKDEIISELMNNPRYEIGYEKAKEVINGLSLDKIADFIEKLNSGYKPKNNDPDNTFSNGEPINYFWQTSKDKIIEELMNNQRYEVGYERAKEVINGLSLDKIADFIEKVNSGYKPKSNDPDNTFSSGEPINYFWSTNKDKIIKELMSNPKYEVGYEKAKEVISGLSFDKIADFIEKVNSGYKPKSNDPDNTFSNGEPINQFWSNNKDKIIEELMNNQRYEVGYERAKEVINGLSLDKIADFIEKLNSGYKPKNNDPDNTFSNGEPINYFWQTSKDKIIEELMNNQRYEVGYERAKEVINGLSLDKIADFIEKVNSGYKPKSNDPDNTFSNGEPINYFWQANKDKIIRELMNNPKYEVGYETAKATILIIIEKSKKLKEKYETAKQEFEEKSKFKEQKQKVELKENIDGRKLS